MSEEHSCLLLCHEDMDFLLCIYADMCLLQYSDGNAAMHKCFLSASRELGGAGKKNNEDDCWWGPVNHWSTHHVWGLPVQWSHCHVNANIPLHQGV